MSSANEFELRISYAFDRILRYKKAAEDQEMGSPIFLKVDTRSFKVHYLPEQTDVIFLNMIETL